MRTIVSWIIGLPVAVVVVLFALSNRAAVTFGLWPFSQGLSVPLFLAVLLPLLTGVLLGLALGGWAVLRSRRALAVQRRRVAALEREAETWRGTAQPAGSSADLPVAASKGVALSS